MKKFYRLLNIEFLTMFKSTLLLCVGAIITSLILLHLTIRDYNRFTVHERFEDIYVSSGSMTIFLIFLVALCAVFLMNIYSKYWGSRSIYTYLTLPVQREILYFSKLAAFMICLLMLLTSHLLSVILGYNLVAEKIGSINEGQFLMNNGLFLAFIRSEYLRILYPVGFQELFSSLSIGIALTTGLYYAALCERSKRYGCLSFVIGAFVLSFTVLNNRINQLLYIESLAYWYITSAVLLLLSGFFIWHSIRLLKQGAIA